MARVRGASLSTEAAELGFWAVIATMAGVLGSAKIKENAVSTATLSQIQKRFEGDLDGVLSAALQAKRLAKSGKLKERVSMGAYEKHRAAIAETNPLASKPGSASWPPGGQTVMSRFGGGTWSGALEAMGLPAHGQGRARGSGSFTDADFADALHAYAALCTKEERPATYSGYCAWTKEEKEAGRPRPSGSTLRQRYRSWSGALAAADVPK